MTKIISSYKIVKFIRRYPRVCVVFLGHQDEPDRYSPVLQDIAERCADIRLFIVNFNLINPAGLDLPNIKIVKLSDIFSAEDYEAMDTAAYGLTCAWHLDLKDREDLAGYKNIKLAELAESSVQPIFSKAIKNAHVVSWAIDLFKPQSAIVMDELGDLKDMKRFITSEYRVPAFRLLSNNFQFSISNAIKQIKDKVALFVSFILDGIMRYLSLRNTSFDKEVLIDRELYFLFKDKWGEGKFIPFLIWEGLRVRLKSLTKIRGIYIPVIIRKSFNFFIYQRRYLNYWSSLKSSPEFQRRFRYNDTIVWALVDRELSKIVIGTFPHIRQNLVFLERFYKRHNLKLVVLRDMTREPERTIISVARLLNIPTLIVQQGALSVKNVYTKIHSDKVAAWGPFTTKWYESFGNDASRCVVTGSPKHDLFFEKEPFIESSKIYSSLGLDSNKKIILHVMDFIRFYPMLAPSFYIDIERIVIEDLLNAIKAIPDTQLILKFHPFEYPDVWKRSLQRYRNIKNVVIVKDFDFFQLIKISSLVTTIFSTGGIDAQLLNKPLICFRYFNSEEPICYSTRGVALAVQRSDELIPAIKKVFEDGTVRQRLDSSRPAFVHDYAYKFDGKSTERILVLMRSMLR